MTVCIASIRSMLLHLNFIAFPFRRKAPQDYYYIVLSYRDINNKRKTKWISTGLKLKGNKKKAEALLLETRKNFKPELIALKDDMLFADFLEQWLSVVKTRIEITTYASYENQVKKTIAPYFRERQITLKNLKATDIQTFYMLQPIRVGTSP